METRRSRVSTSIAKVQSVAVLPHLMVAQSARVSSIPGLLPIRSPRPGSGRWRAGFPPSPGDWRRVQFRDESRRSLLCTGLCNGQPLIWC